MKKIFLSIGLGLLMSTGVFADVLDELNEQLDIIVAPYQNENTYAAMHFDAIETNDEHTVKVGFNAKFRKKGSKNFFEIKVNNLSYDYGDGTAPLTIINGSQALDFTKMIPQEQLDHIIPMLGTLIEEFARQFSNENTSIRGVITSTTKNSAGNYTALSALIASKTDVTKLSEEESAETMVLETVISLNVDLKKGFSVDAYVVSNPAYQGFRKDETGLKELLDKLLARDEETMEEIKTFLSEVDRSASDIVEMGLSAQRAYTTLNNFVKNVL